MANLRVVGTSVLINRISYSNDVCAGVVVKVGELANDEVSIDDVVMFKLDNLVMLPKGAKGHLIDMDNIMMLKRTQ